MLNRKVIRIIVLGEFVVLHVLPRLGSLHNIRELVVGIKATLGSHEGHNYM